MGMRMGGRGLVFILSCLFLFYTFFILLGLRLDSILYSFILLLLLLLLLVLFFDEIEDIAKVPGWVFFIIIILFCSLVCYAIIKTYRSIFYVLIHNDYLFLTQIAPSDNILGYLRRVVKCNKKFMIGMVAMTVCLWLISFFSIITFYTGYAQSIPSFFLLFSLLFSLVSSDSFILLSFSFYLLSLRSSFFPFFFLCLSIFFLFRSFN